MSGRYAPINREDSETPLIPESPTSPQPSWAQASYQNSFTSSFRSTAMSDEVELRVSRKATRRRGLIIMAGLFFLLLIIGAIVILVLLLFLVGQQPPRVQTSCGTVEGTFNSVDRVFSFKVSTRVHPPLLYLYYFDVITNNPFPEPFVSAVCPRPLCVTAFQCLICLLSVGYTLCCSSCWWKEMETTRTSDKKQKWIMLEWYS